MSPSMRRAPARRSWVQRVLRLVLRCSTDPRHRLGRDGARPTTAPAATAPAHRSAGRERRRGRRGVAALAGTGSARQHAGEAPWTRAALVSAASRSMRWPSSMRSLGPPIRERSSTSSRRRTALGPHQPRPRGRLRSGPDDPSDRRDRREHRGAGARRAPRRGRKCASCRGSRTSRSWTATSTSGHRRLRRSTWC